ncbi:hypothetical protein BCR33DRAFT_733743 [Rhizoclosmatium globosum]|uniref:Rho-GAP domain-containing protein n=1 Tax=Rhizoclosmatium globosum TaxID=329046 RepID=A0A1Y2CWL3_9FUNG|nr:hypothetical protein BCR33DRAFT_733743 [Rhizoclosmatium globosum]|eukprot:ORY51422.1 hypothetical protein BCR33DRAFT_733743 [Rhizoclosmatium globosum]
MASHKSSTPIAHKKEKSTTLSYTVASPSTFLGSAQPVQSNQSSPSLHRRQLNILLHTQTHQATSVPVEASEPQVRRHIIFDEVVFQDITGFHKSTSHQLKNDQDIAENTVSKRKNGTASPTSLHSSSSSNNSSSSQLQVNRRSHQQSFSQLVANAFTGSKSRSHTNMKTNDLRPTRPSSTKHSSVDLEGPIFNTTIQQASSLGCKNGIPDIVVQCVEYLERKKLLNTEGIYRVPGSQKRVKEWALKFKETYQSRRSALSRKKSVRKTFSREQSILRRPFSVTQEQKKFHQITR